jgi:hypothetical protein
MFYFNKMKQDEYDHTKQSTWNHHIEEVVKDIGESSKAYKTMHNKEARNANDTYNRLMLAGIITGPLSGIISAIGSSINYTPITITQIALGFLSGIFIAILRFGKYDEVCNSNKCAASKYASLESNVRRQLSLYRKDRFPAVSYLEWTETKYDDLISSAPLLSNHVFEEYSLLAKENNWKIPEQYSDIIDINEDCEDIQGDIESCKKERNIVTVTRSNTMSTLPEINSCSDQMLKYEMQRFMNIK